jgi:hypothetical protein
MQAYRTMTTVDTDGELHLRQIPFRPGTGVEVIVLAADRMKTPAQRYPLRGEPIEYIDPTEPVAKEDWEALR